MYFKMITASLLRRRSRLFVALLAIAIGAMILSGLSSIYYDIPRQMGQEFRSYGANLVLVPAKDGESLTDGDIAKVEKVFPADEIIGITPYRYEIAKINEQPFMLAGTDLVKVQKTRPYWHITGEWPQDDGGVLIGQQVAGVIKLAPGDKFTLAGTDSTGNLYSHDFTVSGIVQTGGAEEGFIFLKRSALDGIMKNQGKIHVIECSIAAPAEKLAGYAGAIAQDPSVSPQLVKQVTRSEETVLGKLQALMYLVTIIVLLLTMICVSTTMMAVVAERRKEIGLKKAIGASSRSIVMEFLGEGAFLGAVGGLMGVLLGYAFAQGISMNVFARKVDFGLWLVPFTIIVSVLLTELACLLPVKNAAEVEPALVLRGE